MASFMTAAATLAGAAAALLLLRSPASTDRLFGDYVQKVSSFARAPGPATGSELTDSQWKDVMSELAVAIRDLPARAVVVRGVRITPALVSAAALYHLELGVEANPGQNSAAQRLQYAMSQQVIAAAHSAGAPPSIILGVCKALTFALQRGLYVQELGANLGNCIQWFPGDPSLLLARGSLFELIASARLAGARERSLVGPRDASLELALSDFAAVRSAPFEIEAATRSVRVLGALGRSSDAADAAVVMLERRSLDADARFIVLMADGDALVLLGRLSEARAAYAEAARLRPGSQSPVFSLASVLMLANEPEQARQQVKSALALASEDHDPLWAYDYGQAPQLPRALADVRLLVRQYSGY